MRATLARLRAVLNLSLVSDCRVPPMNGELTVPSVSAAVWRPTQPRDVVEHPIGGGVERLGIIHDPAHVEIDIVGHLPGRAGVALTLMTGAIGLPVGGRAPW